jgi:hypothetical protein
MVPVIRATVNDAGKLELSALGRELLARHLATLKGKPVEVLIKVHRHQRSVQQSRYYWGVVVPLLGAYCGYDKTEMHELLAYRFLRIEDDPITGSPRRKHTPETNTAEFAAYLDDCLRLAAELGVEIPEPYTVVAA